MAVVLLIAQLGPSKTASAPSPSDFTNRPRPWERAVCLTDGLLYGRPPPPP